MADLEGAPTPVENSTAVPVAGTSALAPETTISQTATQTTATQAIAETPCTAVAHASAARSKWLPPALASMGAAFGSLIGYNIFAQIFSSKTQSFGEFLIIAAIVGAAAYWFFDPLLELVQGWLGMPPREVPEDRRIVTSIAIAATTLVISILHHSLATALEALEGEGPKGSNKYAILTLMFACAAGVTTSSWVRGARRQPPRAASYGAQSGGIAGLVVGGVLAMLLVRDAYPANHLMTSSDTSFVLKGAGLWTFLTLIPGLLGGIAIEKQWDRKSPTRGVLTAMLVFSGISFLTALIVGRLFPQYNMYFWFVALQLIVPSLGWALGPFLQRESCDRIFDPSGVTETVLPNLRRPGTVVVPIDSRRPLDATQTIIPAGMAPELARDFDARRVSPQVLLLQPKGSRAWALAILVLAVAIGAWAYVTGAIRTDDEIVSEIVSRFQQDPNLHSKSLKAESLGHVVTVAGMVDNGTQHSAAVQQAVAVRGVKQVVDEVQLAPPPAPAKPAAAAPAGPTFNAQFSIVAPGQPGAIVVQPGVRPAPRPGPRPAPQRQAQPVQQKRGGLFHLFRKVPVNNNQNRKNGH